MSDYVPYGAYGQAPPLRIGSVFARALGIFRRQWRRALGAWLVVQIATMVLAAFLGFVFSILHGEALGWARPMGSGLFGPRGMGILVGGLAGLGLQSVILSIALLDLAGRRQSLPFAFWRGIRRIPALLGLAILVCLFAGIGLVLLVVPGIIVLIIASIAMNSCIVERAGPWESLCRGAYLAKDNRFKLFEFFVCCVFMIIALVLLLGILQISIILLFRGIVIPGLPFLFISSLPFIVFHGAISIYFSISSVVVYHDLVLLRDGVASETIADALEH